MLVRKYFKLKVSINGNIIGKHAIEGKERLKKRGMSKPGHAVVITGGSTEPPFDDVPVDLSADHKDLVMEYSGNAGINI